MGLPPYKRDVIKQGGARAVALSDLIKIAQQSASMNLESEGEDASFKQYRESTLRFLSDEKDEGKILMINGISRTMKPTEWIKIINQHHEVENNERAGAFTTTALLVQLDAATNDINTTYGLNGYIVDSIINQSAGYSHIKEIKLLEDQLCFSKYDTNESKFVAQQGPPNAKHALIFFGDTRTEDLNRGQKLPLVTQVRTSLAPKPAAMMDEENEVSLEEDYTRTVIISFMGTLGKDVLPAVDKLVKLNNGTIHWCRRSRASGFSSLVITTTSTKAASDLSEYFKSEDYSKNISVLTGSEMYNEDKAVYNLHTNGKFPLDIRNLTKIVPDIRYAHTGMNSIRFTTKIKREVVIETLKEYNITASRLARKKNAKHSSEATFMALTQAGTTITLGSLPRPPTRRINHTWRNEDATKVMSSGPKSIFLLGLHVNMSTTAITMALDTWGFAADDKANACWYYCGNRDTYAVAIKTERAEELSGQQRAITASTGNSRTTYATTNITGYVRCHSNGKVLTADTDRKHRLVVPATADDMFKRDFTIGGGNAVDMVIKELDTTRTAARAKGGVKPPIERNQSTIAFTPVSAPKQATPQTEQKTDELKPTQPLRNSNQFSALMEDEEEEEEEDVVEQEAAKAPKSGKKGKKTSTRKKKKQQEKDDLLAIEEAAKQTEKEKIEAANRLRAERQSARSESVVSEGQPKSGESRLAKVNTKDTAPKAKAKDAQTTQRKSNTKGTPSTTAREAGGGFKKPSKKKRGDPKKVSGRPKKTNTAIPAPAKGSTAKKAMSTFFNKANKVINNTFTKNLGSKPGSVDQQEFDYMQEIDEHQRNKDRVNETSSDGDL